MTEHQDVIKAELRQGFLLRMLVTPTLMAILYIFRGELPFPYPELFFLTVGSLAFTALGVLVYARGLFLERFHSFFPYVDAVFFLPGFFFTGGFMSSVVPLAMVTIWGTPSLYPLQKSLGRNIFFLIVSEYVLVSLAQKLEFYPDPVSFSRDLVQNTPFFLFAFFSIFSAMTVGYMVTQRVHKDLQRRADRGALLMERILSATAQDVGDRFFPVLVQNLAQTLGVKAVFVGRLAGPASMRILAMVSGGKLITDFDHPLAGDPNKADSILHLPDIMAGEERLAQPMYDRAHKLIGVLGVIGVPPGIEREGLSAVLRVFGTRAGAEIERKAEEEKRKQLERALADSRRTEALGRLANGLAHHFGNVLGVISGYGSLIRLKHADELELKNKAEAILSASQRGVDIIQQLRHLTQEGRFRIDIVRLQGLMEASLEMLRATLDKSVDLVVRLEAGEAAILADPAEIEAAVVHLALDASARMGGRGVLSLATSKAVMEAGQPGGLASPDFVVITVSDNGPAMLEDEAGIGSRLTGIQALVKSHGGQVKVKRRSGGGTAISLYLPSLGPRSGIGIQENSNSRPSALGEP